MVVENSPKEDIALDIGHNLLRDLVYLLKAGANQDEKLILQHLLTELTSVVRMDRFTYWQGKPRIQVDVEELGKRITHSCFLLRDLFGTRVILSEIAEWIQDEAPVFVIHPKPALNNETQNTGNVFR